jgi:hypothetical protein
MWWLRLLLTLAAIAWGVQFLVYRERWEAWLLNHGTPGIPRFWHLAPFVFAGVSFVWALMMLTTGLFGAFA